MATRSKIEEAIKKIESKLEKNPSEVLKKAYNDVLRDLKLDLKALGTTVEKDVKKVVKKVKSIGKTSKSKKSDIESAKAELKKRTGKTEEECEKIISQYKSLRATANKRKESEKKSSDKNKKRVTKLKDTGKVIVGTEKKTAEAELESTKGKITKKLDAEISAIKTTVEKDVKKEDLTPSSKTKKINQKVESKVKDVVKKLVVDTTGIIKAIQTSLNRNQNPEESKLFLIKLRSDIDKLLSEFQGGGQLPSGFVQSYDIAQGLKTQPSPKMFGYGGDVSYNGWTNYATWVTSLEILDGIDWKDFNMGDSISTEMVKDYVEEVMEENQELAVSFANRFLDDVNYYEIVENINDEFNLDDGEKSYAKGGKMHDLSTQEGRDKYEKGMSKSNPYQAKRKYDKMGNFLGYYAKGGNLDFDAPYERGGKMKQGYNDRMDESLSMRRGKRASKGQSYKSRRDESKGMSKSMGKRAYSSVRTMDTKKKN